MAGLNQALFWYKDEASFARFQQIIEDKAQLACPYPAWVALAEEGIKAAAKQGVFLVKIEAEPEEFIQWCKIKSRRFDQSSRMRFAAEKMAAKFGRG